ncbi:DNA polymerase delta subunit 3 isoform X2 [Pimephales promelas]|uniref:DNA polymerase delta subunit 3 isoform X2 n=1 Tax=Pimephales promelas TaxID=90988 RepID=UPI0019557109|nr:DNA polymerase delta subunit 3 isoform X2 [Pimephales promelas]KAG1943537.1 DNA polymerase delta subunit [Pimephales promelas]KAG1943539.1 DNA polymerase delta subunit [Pimephales promelas]
MDDLYLDNIDEFVNDQNKIVTYKWLSLTLGVHVNTAKQMLYHYLDQKRRESSGTPLHATYLVSGKLVENGSTCHKVSVVREDKLEAVKAKMDVTFSVHVYSVQRAELKDSSPLYSTDYDAVKENLKNCNKYSAIRCAAAVPMSSVELQRAQEVALVPPVEKEIDKPRINENTSATSKASAKQPAGIMGMFASKNASKSQESSKEVKTEQKDDSSLVETSKTKPASKANPMSNFFGKPAQKKVDEKPNKNNKSIKEETDGHSATSSTASVKQPSPKSEYAVKEEQSKESSALKVESKDTRKSKRSEVVDSDDEKMEKQLKKRRRIKKPQPDSSDDEVVPDSPPVPTKQAPSPKKQVKKEPVSHQEISEVKRRKRRRVLKSHTFVDEEGSFVTEKGYVSESYSESEEEPEPKSQAKDSSSLKQSFGKKEEEKKEKSQKKTSATNKSTKQPSIMGFFQKK